MSSKNKEKNPAEESRFGFLKEESKKALIAPFQILAKFTAVSGAVALIFEVKFFSQFSVQIYISRLSAIFIAFCLLLISNTKIGKRFPVILIHALLLSIIVSFGVMIYLIPRTLLFNSHIISLLIFTAALFLSWEVTNQIIVAIYYNLVFAASIIFNTKAIFILPNMLGSVMLVLVISVMAIVASYINYRLRQEALIKNYEVSISEKKFRNIFENSAEGLFQFTAEGRFIIVNPALIKMLGYANEDEMKRLLLTEDVFKRKSDWELLTKLLDKQGKVRNYRIPLKKKDGTEITVRANVRTNEDDANLIYEGSLQDITQQMQAENEKQKALDALRVEKMKALTVANKAQQESSYKSKFLANMSHEVRTPMNSIMGFLTLIENDMIDGQQELLDFARDTRMAAESLMDIINNILDISKIEAGKMELDEIEFDLREEINKALSIVTLTVKTKGLQLEHHIDESIPKLIYGDPTRFRQIVLNLLSNAIKYTERGKISLNIKEKSRSESSLEVLASVEDSGHGIPSDKLSMLFEPYIQVKSKKGTKEGTGLGLVISKEFVRLMNGEIHVESKLGQGSKFYFNVFFKLYPGIHSIAGQTAKAENEVAVESAETAASIPPVQKEMKPEMENRKRLLLVEDNPISQNLEVKILREVGYAVEAVSSGQEAIEYVKSGSFNLVLMDVEMTDMDGITATKKIRELNSAEAKIPIIAVTAHSSMKDRERCLAAGMDDYIAKPINIHFLKITIDQWLNAPHRD